MIARIKAINDRGEDAIKQHVAESLKIGRLKRMALKKMGIRQEVVNWEPYTLEVEIRGGIGSMMKPDHLKMEIIEAMTKNGARIEEDYTIEIL